MKSEIHSLELSGGLYPYQVVYSKRAKHIRIKLSNRGKLSVVLPVTIEEKFGHSFLLSKAAWVEKNLKKLSFTETKTLPEQLNLCLIDEVWKVDYIESNVNKIEVMESENFKLTVLGNVSDIDAIHYQMNQWCKKKSRVLFKAMLEALAEEHGFHYNGLSIRAQKTRWGSCSSKKNINLNCKLLFMPIGVVKYVMIHELCHTLEMNHSSRFWDLVEDCDQNYNEHRKTLNILGKNLPF